MELSKTVAIRCEHDGLKMAEVKAGCLILRQKHHGETHVQVVPLRSCWATAAARAGHCRVAVDKPFIAKNC